MTLDVLGLLRMVELSPLLILPPPQPTCILLVMINTPPRALAPYPSRSDRHGVTLDVLGLLRMVELSPLLILPPPQPTCIVLVMINTPPARPPHTYLVQIGMV